MWQVLDACILKVKFYIFFFYLNRALDTPVAGHQSPRVFAIFSIALTLWLCPKCA